MVSTEGKHFFARPSGRVFLWGEITMRKGKITDITGTPLTPSRQGRKCLGNGENEDYECCCDECDYYLKCFPQFDIKIKPKRKLRLNKHTNKL